MELYVHIPFCVRKCNYCDFLSGPVSAERCQVYLYALEQEIMAAGREVGDAKVSSVFLGGGTPSLLHADQMCHLMETIGRAFCLLPDCEITAECNPGTADQDKLLAYRNAGINRLSIGVQSFQEEHLKRLGRIHTKEQAVTCFQAAREAGFTNINIDLMSALPGQSLAQWVDDLKMAVSLGPEHISAYSLILEEGTPFFAMEEEGRLPAFPDEETDRAMYHTTRDLLRDAGYEQYEISNYAREGYACDHNLGYWTGREYLGCGIGAASYLGGKRFSNTRDFDKYLSLASDLSKAQDPALTHDLSAIREDVTLQTREDDMEEFMFLGLRLNRGVSEAVFRERFGQDMRQIYGQVLDKHLQDGLLENQDGRICLTDRGRDLANYVMSDFILT